MVRRVVMMACFLGLAIPVLGDEKDNDPIQEKLNTAKMTYEREIKQFYTQVNEWFSAREDAARETGDKKRVDLVKAQRKAFEDNGRVPKDMPANILLKRNRTKKALEEAYAGAVKAYIKAKKDMQAAVAERQLRFLLTTGANKYPQSLLPDVESKEALFKQLSDSAWDWDEGLKLKADGFIEQKVWEKAGLMTKWEAIDRRTIVLSIQKGRQTNRTATLVFSEDLTEVSGFNFDGERLQTKRRKP